jgi:hypothetical protein
MFLSMSRHIEAAEAAAILQAITDEHPGDLDHDHGVPLPPPEMKVMTLTVYEGRQVIETYPHVTASTLVSPTCFRVEMQDGTIVLMEMAGRDFVLVPE